MRAKFTGGKLILSLSGGRKVMSSDIQRAADIYICDTRIHVAGKDLEVQA